MDIEDLLEEVDRRVTMLSFIFQEKFNHTPNYIKIPIWLYDKLCTEYHKLCKGYNDNEEIHTYRGLKVCPTVSIIGISEIEIF